MAPAIAFALPYITAGASVASTGLSLFSALSTPSAPKLPSAQEAPGEIESSYARIMAFRRRRPGLGSTFLTGPLGVVGEPETAKTLLGS